MKATMTGNRRSSRHPALSALLALLLVLTMLPLAAVTQAQAAVGDTLTAENADGAPGAYKVLTEDGPASEPELLATVYLNGAVGDDHNDGSSEQTAVATFARAKQLLDPGADGATIYITGRVTTSGAETWSLAGYTNAMVKRHSSFAQANYSYPVYVGANSTLVLENIVIDGNNMRSSPNSLIMVVGQNASLVMKDGTILQNNPAGNGGAVYIGGAAASFTMDGGIIQGCSLWSGRTDCSSVFAYAGTLNLNGGTFATSKDGLGLQKSSSALRVNIGAVSWSSPVVLYGSNNNHLVLGISAALTSPLVLAPGGTYSTAAGTVVAQGVDGYRISPFDVARFSWNGSGAQTFFRLDALNNQVVLDSFPHYDVTIDPDIANGIVLADKDQAKSGDTVTLTISPEEGFYLIADSLKVNSGTVPLVKVGEGTYTFTMPDTSVAVTAAFEDFAARPAHTITIDSAITGGAVSSDVTNAQSGATVTLSVVPSPGYRLVSNTLQVNGSTAPLTAAGENTYTFIMPDGPVTVTAMFRGVYAITVDSTITDGAVSPSVAEAQGGTRVTLSVAPASGYRLIPGSLKVNDGAVPVASTAGTNTYIFTMPDEPVEVTAAFEDLFANAPPQGEDGLYQISEPADLQWLSICVNEGYRDLNAMLVNDIDLSETEFAAIGSYKYPYRGIFDGGGHAITVEIEGAVERGGIFGYVADSVVKDLTVKGSISGSTDIGGLAFFVVDEGSPALFVDCVNKARLNGTMTTLGSYHIGGIVARDRTGSIYEDCVNYGEITGTGSYYIGGIVGSLENVGSSGGTVTDCVNYGAVRSIELTSHFNGVGGIVGRAVVGTIQGCVNRGRISGTNLVAGIVGDAGSYNSATIKQCINEGDVFAVGMIAGGIAARLKGATLTQCVNLGAVTMEDQNPVYGVAAGGIVGFAASGFTISDNYNGGAIVNHTASISYISKGGMGGIIGVVEAPGYREPELSQCPVADNYNSGVILWRSEGATGESANLFGPIIGDFVSSDPDADTSAVRRNLYASDSIEEDYAVAFGAPVGESTVSSAALLLKSILFATGITDKVQFNLGGYPVPERLWDGQGEPPEGWTEVGESVSIRFNVTPEFATVAVYDSEGISVSPSESDARAYVLQSGRSYGYTVSAEGYTSQTDNVLITAERLITIGLRPSDPGQYVSGWSKWRPSFGIYILNPDGTSGTRIGNWTYDEEQGTYVDEDGEPCPLITDFSDEPLVYSGIDAMPAARLGMVLSGIRTEDIIAYYNDNNGTYPDLTEENHDDFDMKASTNSSATEDPYASNDPTRPGTWALPGAFDSLTGTERFFYPEWLVGASSGDGIRQRALGEGIAVPSVIAVTSYNDRVRNIDASAIGSNQQIDNEAELEAAIAYLAEMADAERALRNFEGMRSDIFSLDPSESGARPLGGDGSYYIGSIWISAPDAEEVPDDRVILDAPELSAEDAEVTATSVTLATPAYSAQDEDATIEYRVFTEGGEHGEWQTSPQFTGLVPETTYIFQARYVTSDTTVYHSSLASVEVAITTLVNTPPGPTVGEPGSGDVDGDGAVTAFDLVTLARFVVGDSGALSGAQVAALDVDSDDVLTMADAVRLLRIIVGL